MISRFRLTLYLAAALCGSLPGFSNAADPVWPTKTVRVVVPYAPGGVTDIVARIVAERLGSALGQGFIGDNRPGGDTDIGTLYVAKQAPDGYTLLVSGNVAQSSIFATPPYDPVKDIAPVSRLFDVVMILAENIKVPAKNVNEFLAYARSQSGKIALAHPAIGGPHHFYLELLMLEAKFDALRVPYKGGVPMVTALSTGEVQFSIGGVNTLKPQDDGGRVRMLAVIGPKRSALAPGLPSIKEALPTFDAPGTWAAMYATAGTPRPVIDRLNAEVVRIVRDPTLAAQTLGPNGLEAVGSTPEELGTMVKDDLAKFKSIAARANMTLK